MLDGGLYSRVPTPDIVLGQHVGPTRAGYVGLRAGPWLTASESYRVTFFGRGGHGATPAATIDPVVMACSAVVRLQSIVAREIDTDAEMAVVTVGSIHAGAVENIIPQTAELRINVRAYDAAVLRRVVASVRRIVRAEAHASGAPCEPALEAIAAFPPTTNDAGVAARLGRAFGGVFGESSFDAHTPRSAASDDFSRFATAVGKPYAYWTIGCIEQDAWDRAEKEGTLADVPKNHMPTFAPAMQPTLRVGVDALCAAVLAYLGTGDVAA